MGTQIGEKQFSNSTDIHAGICQKYINMFKNMKIY